MQLVIIAILGIVVGEFIWSYNNKLTTIDTLEKEVIVQGIAVDSATDTIAKIEIADKITAKTNAVVVAKTKIIVSNNDAIKQKADYAINVISKNVVIKKNADKAIGAVDLGDKVTDGEISKESSDAISKVIIDSLWESYCGADPSSASCTKKVSAT